MLVERERIGQEGSRLPFGYYLEKDADLLTVVPMARSRPRSAPGAWTFSRSR
jgi:hypothetical protein